MLVEGFDWKKPNYSAVFAERFRVLREMQADPTIVPGLRRYYRDNPTQFITDWGCTADPRNVEIGLPVVVPFLLFPRQVEWCDWVIDSWRNRRPGVTPKSRELGVSWLAIALSCTLCLFNEDMVIGFGSRKAELVDKLGDPKSLFWKAREFLSLLPKEFSGGFARSDAPEMRIKFRQTRSTMIGEGGDDIGRGNRTSLYIVDEAAHLAHPEVAEASLSSTTNCRIDIGTANGLGGPFHRKVTTWPKERVFIFHWRSDPRKDQAWYEDQCSKLDATVIAQEIDIDFAASVSGVVIPSGWVQAAIDAHVVLGLEPTGRRQAALDLADEGKDTVAYVQGHGVVVQRIEEWSGKGSHLYATTQRAFRHCDEDGVTLLKYDGDGLGAALRGDAVAINALREPPLVQIAVEAFRGSSAVQDPDREDVKGRKNKDYFMNRKAQAWFSLRRRFEATFKAVRLGLPYDPSEIISLSSTMPLLSKLAAELSQPTYGENTIGKMVINKAPEGTTSPNLADSLMILLGIGQRPPMVISDDAMVGL